MEDKDFSKPDKPSFYPSIFAPPAEKATKEYGLASAKALYYNCWNTYGNAYGNSLRARMIDNRNWSDGRFDVIRFFADDF